MKKCFDCGKKTNNFRCRECYKKAEKGELKYIDTSELSRLHHFGSKTHEMYLKRRKEDK